MNTLVIERQALMENLKQIKKHAKGALLIGDLSADAYGLGLLETARLLADDGVRSFAVATARDAERLRDNGFTEERIMTLRSPSSRGELELLLDLGVVCAVGSYESGVVLSAVAEGRSTVCEVQIMIDSGLGGYGFKPGETDRIFSVYEDMPSLRVTGVFTVLSDPSAGASRVRNEFNAFMGAVDAIRAAGYEPGKVHAADGAAVSRFDYTRLDAVRIGRELGGGLSRRGGAGLRRAAYIEASIEEIDWVNKGERIGVGKGVRLGRARRVAILPVGSYNGFGLGAGQGRRERLLVTVGEDRAPVLGQVGLLDCAADVTDIECRVGDVAVMETDPVYVKGMIRAYR